MVKKNHFIFIRNNRGFGGCEHRLLDWVRKIDFSRSDVTILATSDVFSRTIECNSLPVKVEEVDIGFECTLLNIYRWFKLLKKKSPKKVIFMQGTFYDIPLFLLILGVILSRGKVCMTEHTVAPDPPVKESKLHYNIIPGLGIWWYRTVLPIRLRARLAEEVFAVSESVKRRLVEWGYPERKITLMSHGVNTDMFRPSNGVRASVRRAYEIPDHGTVIISTARLSPEKRIDRLITAFNRLSAEHDDLWLLIIGEGPLMGELTEKIHHRNRAKFLGKMERSEISRFLMGSDIYAQPSDKEGFGIALIEAMATGLLCIATRGSGPDDIITDRVDGFLSNPSTEDFLHTLREVTNLDSEKKEYISRSARKRVEDKFELNRVIESTLGDLGIPFISDEMSRNT